MPDAPSEQWPCPVCGHFQPQVCAICHGKVLDAPLGQPIQPGRGMAAADTVRGFAAYWRAAGHLMTRPEFFGRLGGPVVANMLAMTALAAAAWFGVYPLMSWLAAQSWGPLEVLRDSLPWGDDLLPTALTVTAVVVLGPAVLQTVTIPFLNPLADVVETLLGGPRLSTEARSTWDSLRDNVRGSSQVLAMQLLILPVCLALSFCQLGFVLALLIAAYLNALLWFELPLGRRGYSIEQRIGVVRHNWGRTLGFGIAFSLGMWVPFFNFALLTPAAAVATSALYFRFEKVPRHGASRYRRDL
ncbi:MAG: EI24 domain-containing protein [Planctomycetota bacterium]